MIFLAYYIGMFVRLVLFSWFHLFLASPLISKDSLNIESLDKNISESQIEITLISPDLTDGINVGAVSLEGLVNDLSVDELKLLINAQEVQFVPVVKGYFNQKIYLLDRYNQITLYGSNSARKTFRYQFNIINHSQREKSVDERVPPELSVNYLEEDIFKVLSPHEFENLQVEVSDNKDKIVQLAYIVNDQAPVYLPRKRRLVRLDINKSRRSRSIKLLIYAIDGDGNKTLKKYHFRVEDLSCRLMVSPEYGIYSETPVRFNAVVKGGVGKIRKLYSLTDESGREVVHETINSVSKIFLEGRVTNDNFRASLKIIDENGVEASCRSKMLLKFYPETFPRTFEVLPRTKLQSVRQELHFSLEPPVRKGEITVLLKEHDSKRSYLGKDWKVLGRKKFEAKGLNRLWGVELSRRVPVGKYQMKLSVISGSTEIAFTEKLLIEVTKSQDDTEDLLQEILRGEQ